MIRVRVFGHCYYSVYIVIRLLHLVNQGLEVLRLMDGHLGEHLPVDLNVVLLETGHEAGVVGSVGPAGSIDPGDPELAELTLAELPSHVGILHGLDDSLLCGSKKGMFGTKVPLGLL